jgi:DNA invertase Pin-like site-specific DNA recombinase
MVFNDLIEKAENRKFDCILVWSLDRISRNGGDVERIISLLESGKIKQVRTPSQEFKNEPFHKYMLVQAVANAKLENDQKGVNVVRGLKSKIRDGNWIGWARIGYLNCGDRKGKKWVDKDPVRFEILKRLWELFATGTYSMPAIKKKAEEMGLRARPTKATPEGSMVGINTYYNLFRDVFFIGKMQVGKKQGVKSLQDIKEMILKNEIKGEVFEDYAIVQGSHPPMVSEELFYRVQEILKEKGLSHFARPKTKEFVFAGMIRCGYCEGSVVCEEKVKYRCYKCNRWMTASSSLRIPTRCVACEELLSKETFQNVKNHAYAHCTGKKRGGKACAQLNHGTGRPKVSVALSDLEEQVDALLSRLSMDEAVYDYCIKTLKSEHFQNSIMQDHSLTALQKDHKLARGKMDKLVEMRLNGEIDAELFANKKNELEVKLSEVMKKLESLNKNNTDWVAQTENFLNMAAKARFVFKTGNIHTKREILKSMSSHIFLKEGKLNFTLRKPFDVLIKEGLNEAVNVDAENKIQAFDSHSKKTAQSLFDPKFSEWLPRLDAIRTFWQGVCATCKSERWEKCRHWRYYDYRLPSIFFA